MRSLFQLRHGLAVMILVAVLATSLHAQPPGQPPAGGQPQEEFKNLKVLPKDIPPQELRNIMGSFTRALGVRCAFCHVGQEGQPMRHEDFQKDDKPEKNTARDMLRMVNDINDKYLAGLQDRSNPPVRVQCFTCHHGTTKPRTLQDVLQTSYDKGGLDSTTARYQALRTRYYGSAAYDFGEVPLADLAGGLLRGGHAADAERLFAMNVDQNPNSGFAKRQLAQAVLAREFTQSADSGAAAYRDFKARYGPQVVNEAMVNQLGYSLLGTGQTDAAVGAFTLNTTENPASSNAFDSLGEALLKKGDRKAAIAAYQKAVEIDPSNEDALKNLADMKVKPKKAKSK
jgi:tetratricopeptide (TPR) repeat protein